MKDPTALHIPTQFPFLLAIGLLAVGLSGCRIVRAERLPSPAPTMSSLPPRPTSCLDVAPGTSLSALLDTVPEGAALCLAPGVYAGPLRLKRSVTVWGPRHAIVRSRGQGTTVRIEAPRTQLLGITVDGSGDRYDLEDAGIEVQADDVRIEGVRVVRAIYGIILTRSNRVIVRNNEIIGTGESALGLRGDGIRLWETRDSYVERNVVRHSRDLVIWYSPRNFIVGNTVEWSRYGTHFMHSDDNVVEHNRYLHDVVGVFVMYSHNVTVRHNLVAHAAGAAGVGLGLKDSGGIRGHGNAFIHNATGVYLDGSPTSEDEHNHFDRNEFRLCRTAVVFHASQRGNTFVDNRFRDNQAQVIVEGGGDALQTHWEGNHFDDYVGYDLDGDGIGDVPYELRSLSDELTSRYPSLEFFRGAPVLSLLDAISRLAPLFEPRTILIDRRPRTRPLLPESRHVD